MSRRSGRRFADKGHAPPIIRKPAGRPFMSTDAKPDPVETAASDLSRRGFVATATAVAASGLSLAQSARGAVTQVDMGNLPPYGNGTLPPSIRSRIIAGVNGMNVHILEAGFETPGR